MPFRPQVDDAILIDGFEYRFKPHPVARDMPYGQAGRRATVYQVEANASTLLALKVFSRSFRSPVIAESANRIRPYAGVPGLQVCARLVVTPGRYDSLLEDHPDLKYACLMPWVTGATWQEVMLENRPLTQGQSLNLGFALVRILATMEQKGLAHCDLSGPNIILPGLDAPSIKVPVALVDVEEMFGTNLTRPEKLSAGSPGYAHKSAARGIWNVHADRFAGAVILAEMLCWCAEDFRSQVYGEQFFDPAEIHKEASERYQNMLGILQKLWGEDASQLFSRTWQSKTLGECPSFLEWGRAIFAVQQRAQTDNSLAGLGNFEDQIVVPITSYQSVELIDPEEKTNSRTVAESMLVEAGKLEDQGRARDALDLYRGARTLLAKDDPLYAEIDLIVSSLEDSNRAVEVKNVQPEVVNIPDAPADKAPAPKQGGRFTFSMIGVFAALLLLLGAWQFNLNGFFAQATTPTSKSARTSIASTPDSKLKGTRTPTTTPAKKIPITLTFSPVPAATLRASATSRPELKSPTPTLPALNSAQIIYIKDNGESQMLHKSALDGKSGKDFDDVSILASATNLRIKISPDRKKIVYAVPQGSKFSLNIISMDTGEKQAATLSNTLWDDIFWSPNGKFIAANNSQSGYDLEQDKDINYGERVYDVVWSPDGSKLAGKIGAEEIAIYAAGDNQPRIIIGSFFYWLDDKNLLILSLEQDQTMLVIKKMDIESRASQELYRQGVTSSCPECSDQPKWIISISPSGNKAVMYRKRAPYYDILWLDLSGEKAKGVYEDTKVWLWAGWTSDSQGIFLTYAGASIPEDFPETVVEIPDLAIDASNAYAYAISPTEGQAVVLLCKNNTPAIANCDILLAGGDRQVKKLTAEPQGIYWENGISWSPDGSMLAYVAQKDDASKLVVMSVDDQSEQVVSQTAKQTCLIWVP